MYAIVDFRINTKEKDNLKKLGFELLICPPSNLLYDAVCGHPDMLLKILDNNKILVHKNMDINFINKLKNIGYEVFLSQNSLTNKYPHDIILNSVSLGNIFLHNLKYTDSKLLKFMKNKKKLNVRQGYTKCSTAIVNCNAIITSDLSISNLLKLENVDVLFVPPGDIILPGLNYGFIGGCCGLIAPDTIAFYGNLSHYKYGEKVLDFLEKHHVKPVFLRDGKLIDRGSIFVI